ncbi:hypothetical protein CP10139811_0474 [Chlamydia ibidis]|uniref:Uncharacterized protein n=2 Tax=Chlamydia ibidis TaxID=1405396 RepID=S7J2U0_9CHLA|nr:hypothetical protein [Chlamydia ibidis]EPP34724.1 hypothetical protein CP10139811_0474 [Chlamydia ibidis]EQM62383.1 hypothetical protein H359_0852 [Chlamydia ibidis 10-1398/6]
MKNKIKNLLDDLYNNQQEKLHNLGQEIIPNLTTDDALQPMDFSILEENSFFRFEEGVLMGLGEARAAVLAFFAEENSETR